MTRFVLKASFSRLIFPNKLINFSFGLQACAWKIIWILPVFKINKQKAMSLLECLIAMLVISVAILPLDNRIMNTARDSALINSKLESNYASD